MTNSNITKIFSSTTYRRYGTVMPFLQPAMYFVVHHKIIIKCPLTMGNSTTQENRDGTARASSKYAARYSRVMEFPTTAVW